ncbi:MAG TPA: monovalent cation:proton antiporter-2 (CPA2) family protein [Arenicellales bacterium]|nr:monovalent cation:proton antiporter-2 (CPA2) family protein [Arenicellales bacterium]
MEFIEQATLFLLAAVILVPLFKQIGLGAVLGYLVAGVLIGPSGLGLVDDVDQILHFAEFGVVLLLFIIGLELRPRRLWVMRRAILGLGGLQVLVTTAVLYPLAVFAGLTGTEALVAAFILSLSSTAFALQLLGERRELSTRHGRAAFSVLLFQDIAVIPALAVIPLIGADAVGAEAFTIRELGEVVLTVAAVILVGRYVLSYAFRWIARTGINEVFTAMALLTVVGTALLMEAAGLSMALGAFLAGVLLAESEYRHALEADIEPFKGILLGLFFIAVGMSLNLGLVEGRYGFVAALVLGLVAVKFAVLSLLGRFSGLDWPHSLRLAAILPQGGEFAFVLLSAAVGAGLIAGEQSNLLIVVVTLSMAITPLVYLLVGKALRPVPGKVEFDRIPTSHNQVIIAGFGRVGQIVARILRARKIPFTALDISAEHVDFVRRYGNKIYYGDASRLDMLRAANAEHAAVFVLAIDDVETSVHTARVVRENFPHLKIVARARNRKHAYRLMDIGGVAVWREVFYSSLKMAGNVLKELGLPDREAEKAVSTFEQHDRRRLRQDHDSHTDEERMMYLAREAAQELEELFSRDPQTDDRS